MYINRKNFSKISIFLITAIVMMLSSCGKKGSEKSAYVKNEKLNIVVTAYPVYEWVKNIAQEKASVNLLINSGTDFHSWQPKAKDIVLITSKPTDLFIYIGGESDFWVKKLIPQMEKNGVEHFSVMKENVSVLEQIGEEHDHHHEAEEEVKTDDYDADEFDEHIWLSLKRAPVFIDSIVEKLCVMDEENAGYYRQNAKNYCKKLFNIEEKITEIVTKAQNKTVVVADRFPFKYMACDFGIDFKAAFYGCSSDVEASFDVIMKLSKVMNDNGLESIVITETGNKKLAESILANVEKTGIDIKVLNSMQGKVSEPDNYISIMEYNAGILEEILK